jgi:hypothetical protein
MQKQISLEAQVPRFLRSNLSPVGLAGHVQIENDNDNEHEHDGAVSKASRFASWNIGQTGTICLLPFL